MTVYLQPPGDSPVALPSLSTLQASPDLRAAVHQSLTGVRTVDRIGTPKRTYTVARSALTADEWSVFEEWAYGGLGYDWAYLHDPWRRNLLRPNQATAGDVLKTRDGSVTTQNPQPTVVGPFTGNTQVQGNWLWNWVTPAAGAINNVRFELIDNTLAVPFSLVPIVGGLPYTFQMNVAHQSSVQSWQAGIYFIAADGVTLLSGASGTGAVTTTTLTQRAVVNAAAPGNAAYCWPWIGNTNAMSGSANLLLDAAMLTQGTAVQPWVMGTGVPRVAIADLSDTYRIGYGHDLTATLVEVG